MRSAGMGPTGPAKPAAPAAKAPITPVAATQRISSPLGAISPSLMVPTLEVGVAESQRLSAFVGPDIGTDGLPPRSGVLSRAVVVTSHTPSPKRLLNLAGRFRDLKDVVTGERARREARRIAAEKEAESVRRQEEKFAQEARQYAEASKPVISFLRSNFSPTTRRSRMINADFYDGVCFVRGKNISIKVNKNGVGEGTDIEIYSWGGNGTSAIDYYPFGALLPIEEKLLILRDVMKALRERAGSFSHVLERAFMSPSQSVTLESLFDGLEAIHVDSYLGIGRYKGGVVSAIVVSKPDLGMERIYLHSTDEGVQREFDAHARDDSFYPLQVLRAVASDLANELKSRQYFDYREGLRTEMDRYLQTEAPAHLASVLEAGARPAMRVIAPMLRLAADKDKTVKKAENMDVVDKLDGSMMSFLLGNGTVDPLLALAIFWPDMNDRRGMVYLRDERPILEIADR